MTPEERLRDLNRRCSPVWLRRDGGIYRLIAVTQPRRPGSMGEVMEATGRTAAEAIETAWVEAIVRPPERRRFWTTA